MTADTTVAVSGRHSLKVQVPTSQAFVFPVAAKYGHRAVATPGFGDSVTLKLGTQRYLVSLWVQASPPGTKLALMSGFWHNASHCIYPNYLPPLRGGCPYTGMVVHEVDAGREWAQMKVVIGPGTRLSILDNMTSLQLRVSPARTGKFGATVWIDDVSVAPVAG